MGITRFSGTVIRHLLIFISFLKLVPSLGVAPIVEALESVLSHLINGYRPSAILHCIPQHKATFFWKENVARLSRNSIGVRAALRSHLVLISVLFVLCKHSTHYLKVGLYKFTGSGRHSRYELALRH